MNMSVIILILVIAGLIWAWIFHNKLRKNAGKKKTETVSTSDGIYYLALGDSKKALISFRNIVTYGAPLPETYLAIAILMRRKGDVEKSIQINEALIKRNGIPSDLIEKILTELGRSYRITNNLHNVEKCLDFLSETGGVWPQAVLLRAELLAERQDFDGALRKYARYTKLTGISPDKYISNTYIRMAAAAKDEQGKLKALRNAVKANPLDRRARFEMAGIYFDTDNFTRGFELCREMIAGDLLRTKEDVGRMEEIYYRYATMEELLILMLSRIANDTISPVPYLFAARYYRKKGEPAKGAAILKGYLEQHRPKVVIAKEYARLSDDSVLQVLTADAALYSCSECGADLSVFNDVCPVCGGMATIDYK